MASSRTVWVKSSAVPGSKPKVIRRKSSGCHTPRRTPKVKVKKVVANGNLPAPPLGNDSSHHETPAVDNSSSVSASKDTTEAVSDAELLAMQVIERSGEWEWKRGQMERDGDALKIALEDPKMTFTLPSTSLQEDSVVIANEFNGEYPDDLIGLANLHEPAVITSLKHRYLREASPQVYTSTGPVLIALNPFQVIENLYSADTMETYWTSAEQGLTEPLPPHVFSIADNAFRSMMRGLESSLDDKTIARQSDQTILVSGESGAGKTVTTKFSMKYLAALSQRAGSDEARAYLKVNSSTETTSQKLSSSSIEAQVLESNAILESFGNARTIRNDNSSRFGKFIEMQFTRHGKLVGTRIDTYLLEKVRLVSQSIGERNYHIFYELLSKGSLSEEERGMLHFRKGTKPADFPILQSGTTDRRDGVNDKDTFRDLKNAMTTMGFSDAEKMAVFKIAASTLHASSISVKELDQESVLDKENPSLATSCALLGVSEDVLNSGLCYTTVVIGGQEIRRAQSAAAVEKSLKALIKAVYGALFSYLVERVNSKIAYRETEETKSDPYGHPVASIGVLDIFGFESFTVNSFEQLCINYCNEKLQQQFNTFLLKNEQAEYEREGIEWSFIEFPDNQAALNLIEDKKSGLFRILDDKCKVELPGNPDHSYVMDVYKRCEDMPRFKADRNQKGFFQFAVQHYAGVVEYTTDGFVEKNRDLFPKECLSLLKTSDSKLVQHLVSLIDHRFGGGAGGQKQRSSNTAHTVSGQFRVQLKDLRDKIDSTAPHYIRCIKPNDSLKPGDFQAGIVAEQLRCGGILEAIRVTRAGFTQHYPHQEFVQRYRTLAWKELAKKNSQGPKVLKRLALKDMDSEAYKAECQTLMEVIHERLSTMTELQAEDQDGSIGTKVLLQMGKTKVFLRHQTFEILEQIRGHEQNNAATMLNAIFRRHLSRVAYIEVRKAFRAELAAAGTDFETWYAENRGGVSVKAGPGSRLVSQRVRMLSQKLQLNKKNKTLNIHSLMHGLSSNGNGPAWIVRDGIWTRRKLETNAGKEEELSSDGIYEEPEAKGRILTETPEQ